MNIFQWNFSWNWKVFIQENALENAVCQTVAILSLPQCVNLNESYKVSINNWNTKINTSSSGWLTRWNRVYSARFLLGGSLFWGPFLWRFFLAASSFLFSFFLAPLPHTEEDILWWKRANKICSIQRFNSLRPSDAYTRQQTNHHWFR